MKKVTTTKSILLKINSLNKNEQKLLFLILSEIDPIKDNSENGKIIKLQKKYIKEVLNFKNNKFYSDIVTITSKLNTTLIFEKTDQKTEDYFHWTWISTAQNRHWDSFIEFEISPKMMEYFTNLKPPYCSVNIEDIVNLKSKYSIWIYTLILSDLYKLRKYSQPLVYSVEFLENILDVNYVYRDFKRRVLAVALKDIWEHTDLEIDFLELKQWRKVAEINFLVTKKIKLKNVLEEDWNNENIIYERLIEKWINKETAYEIINDKNITLECIKKNLKYVDHLLNNGYKNIKSISGFTLEAIQKDYAWAKNNLKKELKIKQEKTKEKSENIKITKANKTQEDKQKCHNWWNDLPQDSREKLLNENKMWSNYLDLPKIIQSRIFSKYLKWEIV